MDKYSDYRPIYLNCLRGFKICWFKVLDYAEGDGILYNYEYSGGQFLDRGDPIDIGAPVGNQSGGIYGQQVINNLGNTVAVPIRDLVVPNPYTLE